MKDIRFHNKIIILNFILSCCIVATHIYIDDYVGIYATEGNFILDIQRGFVQLLQGPITAIALSLFYAMSAFLFYYTINPDNLFRKMRSRVNTLVIPYLMWNTIGFFFFFGIGNAEVSEIFEYVVFAKNNPTYFMGIIALYTAFAPILWKLLKQRYVGLFVVAVSIGISILGINVAIPGMNYMNFITTSIPNLCYYVLGAYLGLHGKRFVTNSVKEKYGYIGIATIVLILCCIGYQYFYSMRVIIRILGMTSVWIIMDKFRFENDPPNICKNSFVIYCSHIMINGIYYKLLKLVCPPFEWFPIVSTLLVATLSIITIYCGYLVVKKNMPRTAMLLSGSRG